MKLKYKFAIKRMEDKFYAFTIDEDAGKFDGALKLNQYGMMIIKALRSDVSREDIIERLKDHFPDAAELEKQVDAFLAKLKTADLLE